MSHTCECEKVRKDKQQLAWWFLEFMIWGEV
jgi:hypothetical protein